MVRVKVAALRAVGWLVAVGEVAGYMVAGWVEAGVAEGV